MRFIAALFIACTGIVSLKGQSNTHEKNDSIIIAEILNKLNQFHITGDIEKIKYLHADLWELGLGNKYLDSQDWKNRVNKRIELYLGIIKALNEKGDVGFNPEANALFLRVPVPCDVFINDFGVLFPDPDQIADDSCRVRYLELIRKNEEAKVRNRYNYDLSLIYGGVIDEIIEVFRDEKTFLTPADMQIFIPPVLEETISSDELKARIKCDLGLE